MLSERRYSNHLRNLLHSHKVLYWGNSPGDRLGSNISSMHFFAHAMIFESDIHLFSDYLVCKDKLKGYGRDMSGVGGMMGGNFPEMLSLKFPIRLGAAWQNCRSSPILSFAAVGSGTETWPTPFVPRSLIPPSVTFDKYRRLGRYSMSTSWSIVQGGEVG